MAKVNTSSYIFKKGTYFGLPAFKIQIEGEGYSKEDHNNTVALALNSRYKNIVINGNLTKNPVLKETIQGLTSKNLIVSFVTDGEDNIGPLRMCRNIKFILNIIVPTAEQNFLNPANLPLLKTDDEICFILSNKKQYEDALMFLKGKTITLPTVIFVLMSVDFKEPKDLKDLEQKFLVDATTFSFKSRLQTY